MSRKFTFVEVCLQVLAAFHLAFLQNLYVEMIFLILYIVLFTTYWPIIVLSIFWTWYDRETPYEGGRRLRLLTDMPYLKYLPDYFPMRLIKTADLDSNRNYLFCSHPHGLLAFSQFINFALELTPIKAFFPGFRTNLAAIDLNMKYPLLRDIAMGCGLVSASKKSLTYLLNDSRKGNIVSLVIGGAEEVIYSVPGQYRIILNKRKGFVKIALTLGCCLVPVFNFGENDIYELLIPTPGTFLYRFQMWLKSRTGFLLVIPKGRLGLPFLPKRKPITTVVGRPIEIPKIAEPTQEQIDQYHKLYTEELLRLFNEHKHKYVDDYENTHLEIVG
ncbi:2-acylglycerol O-acyltransferase 2 [Halyomorpha halys]|uniref:2-acylglycerol O-acyltransferase 2 n=1 Tax=Halyomorpha halys TaxID=286706 RepID=UPI0006D514B9|nr:2-acylglycerol O-acyltransferase 2-like [Halyomorpha halys]